MNVLDNMVVPDVPLPEVINANAHPVHGKQSSSYQPHFQTEDSEKFLLVCSRDLEPEEIALLELYGKVLRYDDCHVNIPLDQLIDQGTPVSYIIFDVRLKSHRMALAKESGDESFHLIAIIHKWEQFDDFIDDANCENCLTSLPAKQAFKKDFDKLLLEKKIRSPSCMKSVMRTFLKVLGGWAKE